MQNLNDLSNLMFEWSLINEHGTCLIPIEDIGDKYFKKGEKSIKSKYSSGELKKNGLNVFRCSDSQKDPLFVHTSDLVSFLLKRRDVAISA